MDLAGWSLSGERDDDNTRQVNKGNVPRCFGSPSKILDLTSWQLKALGRFTDIAVSRT